MRPTRSKIYRGANLWAYAHLGWTVLLFIALAAVIGLISRDVRMSVMMLAVFLILVWGFRPGTAKHERATPTFSRFRSVGAPGGAPVGRRRAERDTVGPPFDGPIP
jgi:hypothetical protein